MRKKREENMKGNLDIAKEVLEGKWGNGADRKQRITEAGYNYEDVQGIVNALLTDTQYEEPKEESKLEILGTEYMDIDVNLNQYKGIKLTFKVE